MEFGRIQHLEDIDFTLPPDDAMNAELWKQLGGDGSAPAALPHIYVGAARWGSKDWVGKVYPKTAKEKDFLSYYVQQFNCIELNSLFHHLQPKEVIEKWSAMAGVDFRFCPKYSNSITHVRQLKNAEAETDQFVDHMRSFGRRLGPCFLQLSDSFAPDRAKILQDFLRNLPAGFDTCIELRHPDWFLSGPATSNNSETGPSRFGSHAYSEAIRSSWNLFRELGIGTVITDTAGRRDVLHMRVTAPFVFIRFVGHNLHPSDFPRIDAWVERIRDWTSKGMREVYFFVHNHDELCTPELCAYAIARFNAICGTALRSPQITAEKKSEKSGGENLRLF
jgi:uncharacterized protein YecE (DUF72 family)